MKKTAYKIAKRFLLKKLIMSGYSEYTALVTIKELEEDFLGNKDINMITKYRMYKKGYFSERLKSYRIDNESKLSDYIPEIKYYKLHPVNGYYTKWIDDKLTIRYIFSPFSKYFPDYYFQIQNGKVLKLIDCPDDYNAGIEGIIQLLKIKGNLAAKLIAGTRGQGFCKLAFSDNKFYFNNELQTETELFGRIASMDGYIITEFIKPYNAISDIFPLSSNSVRVMVINDNSEPQITGAFIRFGTKKSGVVDNISAGGIFCGVDITDGTLFNPYQYDQNMNVIDANVHPDTGMEISGQIRNWGLLKEELIRIGRYLPQLCYLGYDIIVTENSFKIIEVNSHQGLQHMQLYYPAMKNDYSRRFFEKLLKI